MNSVIILLACMAVAVNCATFNSQFQNRNQFNSNPYNNQFSNNYRQQQYNNFQQQPYKPFFSTQAPVVKVTTVLPPKAYNAESNARTLKESSEINPDDTYSYAFDTENGISAHQEGGPRNLGGNPPVVAEVAQGGFSWTSPEGQVITINYVADENGYQPQGDAIPQPPPIPPQIARALDYIARTRSSV